MIRRFWEEKKPVVVFAGMLTTLCLVLFVVRILVTDVHRYMFIPGNLVLVWLPLLVGFVLLKEIEGKTWLTPGRLLLTLVWLITLPNTWYVLTDFIHLRSTGEVSEYFDIVLLACLVGAGFVIGFASLYEVHKELNKRINHVKAFWVVMGIILMSSFAIYMGRDLRWNSWDLLVNPQEIIFDVSDRIVAPLAHPKALNMTGLFFALLSTIYTGIWMALRPKMAK